MENDNKTKRKGYMSMPQKQRLIELLSEEPALRSGKFSTSFTKQIADAKWNGIADKLNAIPGGNKNAQEWKRAWADLKTKTKGKNFQIKKYTNKTGGGPSCSIHLNETDEQILSLINPTTITGHVDVAESQVDFSFQSESNFATIGDELAIEGDEIAIVDNAIRIENNEVYINNQDIEPIDNNFSIITVLNTSSLSIDQEKELVQSSEKDKIQDSDAIDYPKKSQKRRSVAAVRLQKSVTATEQLVEIAKQKLSIKKKYYDKKLKLLEQKNQLLLRQVIAHEKSIEKCKPV